jgi:heptosyltransferase III
MNNLTIGISREQALGDVIMTTGIVRKIKRDRPKAKIIIFTKYPQVFDGEEVSFVDYKDSLYGKCDIILDLDMCYERRPDTSVVQCYADYVFGKGNCMLNEVKPFLNDLTLESISHCKPGHNVVIHAIGKYNPAKHILQKVWEEVSEVLISKGYFVYFVGTGKDIDMGNGVNHMTLRNLSIHELREHIKNADLFIGSDSGPLHIAMTTKTPIRAIFTIADPKNIIWRNENVRIIQPGLTCQGCLSRTPSPVTSLTCRTYECTKRITVGKILEGMCN